MQLSDLYLIENVIIQKKIQMTMKTFAPPFFKHFNLSVNRKNRVVTRAMRKKLNIFTLQLLIYHILEQEISIGTNVDISKTKRDKQIVFVVERCMQCLWLLLKFQSAREASNHPIFMCNSPTISLIYLVDEFFFLLLVKLNEKRTLEESRKSKVLFFFYQC